MATRTVPQGTDTPSPRTADDVRDAAPTAPSASDRYDALLAKLLQLRSMLYMTYGNAAETFNCMNEHMRDDFLSACADMARDCKDLATSLSSQIYGSKAAAEQEESSHG